ncbi:MAG: SpoIIE family protein phosphatase [Clostridia bacterium]|nr:SpoIIE family protein phosphatase [Clostridia bacterium]
MQKKDFVVHIGAAVTFLILSFVEFMDISSLGVGLLAALYALNINVIISATFMVLSALVDFSWAKLIYNVSAGLVFAILWIVSKRFKLSGRWTVVGAFFSHTYLIVLAILQQINIIAAITNVFLSLVFAYLCYSFGVPILKNKLRYKFLDSELIAGGIIMIALSIGLSAIELPFPIVAAVFAFSVLLGAKIFGLSALWIGLCFALGNAICSGIELVGAFALMSLTALIFIPAPKILSPLSLIMSFVMYVFFFNVMPSQMWMWLVALFVGGLAYICIPAKEIDRAKEFFAPSGRRALRAMVNRNRVATGERLQSVSDVFGKMSVIMQSEEEISDKHLYALKENLVGSVCALCKRYESCMECGIMVSVGQVMESSLELGRTAVSELPDQIKSSCINIAALISRSAALAEGFLAKKAELKCVNFAKKMVSVQLKGVSDMLASMARKEAELLKFDQSVEEKIAEELTYRGVVTSEALVSKGDCAVMLTVLTQSLNVSVIKTVLKSILGFSFCINKTESGSQPDWTVVYASVNPKFDVVFSVSSCAKDKNGVSGDTHSFIKIDSHRFMMAVCDGMGSGEKANKFSEYTISLIENFYKADFNHSLVLSSVNDFLSLSSEEIYSAVDIAVVDLSSGICDVIKIGSPTSYLKTKEGVLRIEGSALPIGVLDEMKPTIVSYPIKGGETIVFTTDGAADSYQGNALADVINNSTKLPAELCKMVVDGALRNTGSPIDDITVAAFHVFETI